MPHHIIRFIKPLLIALAVIMSLASANGVAEEQNRDRSGSPDGSNTCQSCHNGGNYNPQVNIELEDVLNQSVDSFIPGHSYRLKIQINSIPFPSVYGFQASFLNEDLEDSGVFSSPSANTQIQIVENENIMNRQVIEHNSPSFVGQFSVDWTAPDTPEEMTLYVSGIAANGNDETSGDRAISVSRSFFPKISSSTQELSEEKQGIITLSFPNLLYNHSDWSQTINLWDGHGKLVHRALLSPGQELNLSDLNFPKGTYFIKPERYQAKYEVQSLVWINH